MRNLHRSICLCILLSVASFAKAQTITITKPNGGEVLYPCQSYTITWNQTGSPSNYWNIDYSIDGGTIWASVATNYLATNGQFAWTVPNVTTSTALIRVYDAQNPATTDRSDALFSIQKPVTLTSPNGGETLTGNSGYNITWDAIAGTSTFSISYSLNNGSTWTTIVNNYDAASRSYAWTVPTVALSTTCLVRVGYFAQSCTQDVSDAVFTITPPTPILTSPNGGNTWQLLCAQSITWNTATLYTNARIDYSTNGGASWNLIVDGTTNDGEYTWYVPVDIPPSTNCLIRICNSNYVSLTDASNAPFTIPQPVTITSFNNGGTATGCGTAAISFSKTPCAGTWYIYYSVDNGANYTSIGSLSDNGFNTQTYNWPVPNGINSTIAKFKVSSGSYSAYISDESEGNFTIIPSNDITVTSPNGGEIFTGLTSRNISWTNLPSSSGQYNINYSTDNGSTWTSIASNITGNSYVWSVPNLNATNCRIRVQDYVNSCKFDISDAVFTIAPATPVLTSPNGGNNWQLGCNYNITWNTATLYTNVRLDYSVDNGTTWVTIVNNTGNAGTYAWTVPTTLAASSQCLIRISNVGNLTLNDVSNAPFNILVPLTVTSFNTGGTVIGCGTATISFTKSPCLGNWYLYYSENDGANYSFIASVTDNGSTSQTYTWSVPNDVNTSTAKIKVTSVNNFAITDESEGNFTIIPSNDITVISPNGGEIFQGLTNQTITWTNLPTASGQYNVQYHNGSFWSTIASNITGNSYVWSIPNMNVTTSRIRVQDYLNTCKNDVSDATFTINPATPVLTSPNVAQTWNFGCSYNITWLTSTLYTTVKIDYSVDNGANWVQITSATSNNGTYQWTVPTNFTPTTQFLIRISNTGNLALNDVSNAPVTIAQPVTVNSFNSGGTVVGCNSTTISFTKTPCLGGSWYLYYSIDNGTSWSYIWYVTDNGSATQTYSWQVPNEVNSTTAKIRVMNFNYPGIADESEGNFTIIPSNDITVTSPNGGETLSGLTNHNVTWTNLPSASGQYNIHYSTNGGSTWTNIATNITGNTYIWNVPNISAANCRVRVQDNLNTCKYDMSDANFTIAPATPVLTSPNVAQTWQLGCSYNITWLSSTLYTTAKIDYSLDNGVTWVQIVSSAANNGTYQWTVPTSITPSTQCLIRISNTGNLALNDISNSPFTIATPVTVTSFNTGGTVVGCNNANINFTKTPCLGSSWYVYYSVDNGSNYSYVGYVTEDGTSSQSFTWQVPNEVSTTTAKIKVSNFNYPNATDESDGNFTIIPSNDITVTSPNGGEVLTGLSPYTITWTNQPTASGQYTLRYSTNGTTFTTIASNITGNSYVWTPPNVATTSTCLVRVTDYVNSCKYDQSDANFTINPATPILNSPNAAQTWQIGCSYNITWNTASLYTNVRIDYTTDGGTTWNNIATAASNNGTWAWTVPTTFTAGMQCLFRISNTGNLSLNDVSNAPVTIGIPVTVNSFNTAGSALTGCSTTNISFTKTPCIGNWYIFYSLNNGTTWDYLTSVTDNGLATQSYTWNIPNDLNSTTAKIKVASVSNLAIEDESDASFSITPSNDIRVTSANGGESWQGLSTKLITWTNLPGASGQYTLRYSTNNGSTWSTIATNITGNAYNWTVPNLSSTQCLVRVIDYVNTCKYDVSDAAFTIVPATPVLTAPNGGQSWYAGTVNNITWNTATLYTSTVRLDYSVDNGANWINIISNATNNGTYSWTVPLENSTNCLVRVSNFGDLPVNDVSDAVFTIKPAVTVLTPNGGEQVNNIGGCTITSITFDHSPAFTTFYIEYTLNDGANWIPITSSFSATANPATYNWNVPNVSSNQVRVRVRPTVNAYTDASDNMFPIIKAVTLIQPNFGGIMQAGTNYEISWSSDGISSVYDLFYTTNGTTYTNIVTGYNTSTNKYSWLVPNIPSTNCRIVIRDNINTCKRDTSDFAFIISSLPAPITLTKPNGIEDTLSACANYNITWTETSPAGSYNIDYSLNSGSTWVNIINNYATNTGTYSWAVPQGINSNTVLMRISAAANPATFDLSNSFFVIKQPIYTFTGNGNWSNPANWANNAVPPTNPPACTQIIIDNQAGGECILDIPYTVPAGASFIVRPGKKITIPGNLNIQ